MTASEAGRSERKILVINGPNLNLLGHRDTSIYGKKKLAAIEREVQLVAEELACQVNWQTRNGEGAIIDLIQESWTAEEENLDGIIINPGAYSHYSLAIRDALQDCPLPVVEVHLSNIQAREEFRQVTVTGAVAEGIISGFGGRGYALALQALVDLLKKRENEG